MHFPFVFRVTPPPSQKFFGIVHCGPACGWGGDVDTAYVQGSEVPILGTFSGTLSGKWAKVGKMGENGEKWGEMGKNGGKWGEMGGGNGGKWGTNGGGLDCSVAKLCGGHAFPLCAPANHSFDCFA